MVEQYSLCLRPLVFLALAHKYLILSFFSILHFNCLLLLPHFEHLNEFIKVLGNFCLQFYRLQCERLFYVLHACNTDFEFGLLL